MSYFEIIINYSTPFSLRVIMPQNETESIFLLQFYFYWSSANLSSSGNWLKYKKTAQLLEQFYLFSLF